MVADASAADGMPRAETACDIDVPGILPNADLADLYCARMSNDAGVDPADPYCAFVSTMCIVCGITTLFPSVV